MRSFLSSLLRALNPIILLRATCFASMSSLQPFDIQMELLSLFWEPLGCSTLADWLQKRNLWFLVSNVLTIRFNLKRSLTILRMSRLSSKTFDVASKALLSLSFLQKRLVQHRILINDVQRRDALILPMALLKILRSACYKPRPAKILSFRP